MVEVRCTSMRANLRFTSPTELSWVLKQIHPSIAMKMVDRVRTELADWR